MGTTSGYQDLEWVSQSAAEGKRAATSFVTVGSGMSMASDVSDPHQWRIEPIDAPTGLSYTIQLMKTTCRIQGAQATNCEGFPGKWSFFDDGSDLSHGAS